MKRIIKQKIKNARGMVKENVAVYPELVKGLRLTGSLRHVSATKIGQ